MTTQNSELRKEFENTILIWSSKVSGLRREALSDECQELLDMLIKDVRSHNIKMLEDVIGEDEFMDADSHGVKLPDQVQHIKNSLRNAQRQRAHQYTQEVE